MSETNQASIKQTTTADQPTAATTRFTIFHRVEHWIFISSFITLGTTGLVQKFANSPISLFVVRTLGGIENTRLIHHIAATLMMIVVIYHLGAVTYRLYVQRVRPTMLPSLFDFRAFGQYVLYFIGKRQGLPQQGRFTFQEKLEYWAVVWGTVIMVFTGFMMWNPITTTKFLPGDIIPAAKLAHGSEAILAVLSIIIWHFYHVFIKHFDKSMYTGKLSEEEMLEDHPLELADIKAGTARLSVDPKTYQRRIKIFLPTYGVFAAILAVFLFLFITGEKTALATIRPEGGTVEVFVPLTPTPLPTPLPTPTPAPVTSVTWEGGIGQLFQTQCGSCHNSTTKIAGLDLTSYQAALEGNSTGPVILPGDPDTSKIIIVQSAGNHPGQLSEEELKLIQEWIRAGALEK